jgi:hypothetical protein
LFRFVPLSPGDKPSALPFNCKNVVVSEQTKGRPLKSDHDEVRYQLLRLRLLVGWTQFDVARTSGVGRTRVSLYENGHVCLSQPEIAAILASLREAADALVATIRWASRASSKGQG